MPRERYKADRGRTERTRFKGGPTKEDASAGGLLGNLFEDVSDTVLGIPAGLVETVRNPVKTAKAIGQSYADTYGPLTHGDVSSFLHNLYEHPLGPVLDVLTVATLGGAGYAKAAQVAGKVGTLEQVALRSPRAIVEGAGPVVQGKVLSRNPVIKARQQAVDAALKKFPEHTPFVGEIARYGREVGKLDRKRALARQLRMRDYNKTVARLKPEEMAALSLVSRGVSPRDWLRYLESEGTIGAHTRKVLENPEIDQLWRQPNTKIIEAHAAAKELSEFDATLKIEKGVLTPETAAGKIGQHRRIVEEKLGPIDPAPLDQFYLPDRMVADKVANQDLARMGGGIGNPDFAVKQNRGILFRTGQLALEPDVLGPEFLRTVKLSLFDDLHSELLAGAVRRDRSLGVPKGWMPLRRRIVEGRVATTAVGRSEKLKYTEKNKGQHVQDLARLTDDQLDEGLQRELEPGFTAKPDLSDAEELHGYILIVPERLAKQVAGEFQRSGKAMRYMFERPTQVWRAIVLGYRPAFLVNNLVGNNLLYALAFAGPAGARAYYDAVRTVKGPRWAERLLKDPRTRDVLDQPFMREFFPEQVEGTFGGTQAFPRIRNPKARKLAKATKVGVVPATQAAAEGLLRRAAVNRQLRKAPEVRAILKQMPAQTRSFKEAAKRALAENPALQRKVSQEVNDALGDYFSLSALERGAVRAAFPFYAWYRAISVVTLKLAVDSPVRADLLAKIGEVGDELSQDQLGELPSGMQGAVPVGRGLADFLLGGTREDLQPIATTGGFNPFATVDQLGRSAGAFLVGEPGSAASTLGSQMNPLIQSVIEQMTGKALFTGQDVKRTLPSFPLGVGENVVRGLPPVGLLRGPSKLYPERDLRSQLLAYLGVPVRELDVGKANAVARR